MEPPKDTKRVYHASMSDVPETIVLRYGRKGNPHAVDTYELDCDNAAWVEVLTLRAPVSRPVGGLRLEE